MINPMDLTGKHIVVTGASSGLGRETCILLSKLGARVSLIARNETKLSETKSNMNENSHNIFVFDVQNIEEIEPLVNNIVDTNGKIDGFVHCAGIGTLKPLSMTKYDFLLEMMKIHFFAFVEFTRIITKKRNSNNYASIVAISSAGTISSDKGKVAYSATKGALDKVVRPMAVELGELRKIRVNTINPGWIKTDMYYGFIEEFGQDRMDEILKTHVLGASEPVEIASMIAYLLSDSSKKITGQNIVIDGGWTIW